MGTMIKGGGEAVIVKLRGISNVYEEIAEQYKNYIRLGVLKEGEKLPSCRELALELGVNPNTVERAYAQLESGGYVITMPKKGVYVRGQKNDRWEVLKEAQKQIIALRDSGITKEEISKMIDQVYQNNNAENKDGDNDKNKENSSL